MKKLSKYNIEESLEYLQNELQRREHEEDEEIFWVSSKGEEINIRELNYVHLKNIINKLERMKLLFDESYNDV